ncbi:MAG TPA: glycogen debranching protein GlgX [Pseudonocardiaceae bacterium]|nr:glycogen debranching protein GlgX [Pseudonocardiaceae bacterium]
MRPWPGSPYPLGASYDGAGTNFALFSDAADHVELCLFDGDGNETHIELTEVDGLVHHGYLLGVMPGQRYGYRVHGRYDPGRGLRCNPAKLLIDPYAKMVDGTLDWHESLFGYRFDAPDERSEADSAPHMPKSVVINPFFNWAEDRSPRTPYNESLIYEAHVRGLTIRHPDIPPELRGTYAGLAHPAMIDHLSRIGATAVELMPVHQFVPEHHLVQHGLTNYWGYNTIAFLAPHNAYAATPDPVGEFKAMVRSLHEAGIEVILDVVYNHTAEGNHLGPTLSLRGIDNVSYYRLEERDPRYYTDYTGTGNSLNVRHPHTLQLIMDSLRYWVTEMRVDGFRFDLASTLAREFYDVDRLASFFDLVHQDPTVSQVKLIAEPWDVGPGGYQVGNFPVLWSEWNGKYRDTVRDFWRGKPGTLGEFAFRLTGSSDLYQADGRKPYASINFVTAHDGFTVNDLVSYDDKHNEANGENNRDGTTDNRSWNCGAEGPTDDAGINDLRARQRRNLLATLLLSQGVPMLLHGDELGRTQHGNNNAYCQDNEIAWVDWDLAAKNEELTDFVAGVAWLRRDHPVFRRRRFFVGRPIRSDDLSQPAVPDIAWFTPDRRMTDHDWNSGFGRCITVFLNGQGTGEVDSRAEPIVDDSFLMCFNAHDGDLDVRLPGAEYGAGWALMVDTATGQAHSTVPADPRCYGPGEAVRVTARSLVVLQRVE